MYKRPLIKPTGSSRISFVPNFLMAGGAVVGLGYYIKESLFARIYGKTIQLYDDSGPVEPSVKLQDMVLQVKEKLGESVSENTPIRPVVIPGTRTKHSGTMGTFEGGIIGLPYFFEFNKMEEIPGKIQWDQTSGTEVEEMYKSFLLSDEAKKYGIAREILLVNSPTVYLDTILPTAVGFLVEQFASHSTTQAELVKLPSNLKTIFFVLVIVLGIVIWRFLHMMLQRRYEYKTEKNISQLGEDYIRGAIEYNTKETQRNLYSATMKDQKNRFIKYLSDFLRALFSAKQNPSQIVRFYESLAVNDEELKSSE